MGSTKGNRRSEIRTHPHAETGKTVSFGHIGKQFEVQRRFFVDRRNTHEAFDVEAEVVGAIFYESIDIRRQNAGFLCLLTRIDLHKDR